jgi:hypothetical protein
MGVNNTSYRLGVTQDVAISASSVQSAAFGLQARVIRLKSTGDARFAISKNPTATSSSILILTGDTEYVNVNPGEKIAVIQEGSSTGTINVTENE